MADKPITRERLDAHTPEYLTCPFCNKLTEKEDIKIIEESKEEQGRIVYLKQSFICECGKEIMSMTAKD